MPVVMLVFFFGCTSGNATEAIMEVRPNQIILAADSLVTRGKYSHNGCKILQAGSFFFIPIGLVAHVQTKFKIETFISVAARKEPDSTKRMLDYAGGLLLPALQNEVDYARRKATTIPDQISADHIIKIFAARETGVGLEGYAKDFIIESGRVYTDPAHTCREEEEGNCRLYTSEALRAFAIQFPSLWNTESIDSLMGRAIAANRRFSGPPISILAIAPNATHWVRQNDCADIQAYPKKPTPPKTKVY